jgi:eukaryotic-like serine/threonine-protein kinase
MKQCPTCGVRFDERATRCPIDGAQLVSVPDPLLGRIVQDRYQIEALLGSGGMASVYRGRHQLIDRQVALKFLKSKQARDETSRARFLREARAVNRVQHEHIIDVSDFGETSDGLVYMVMEYLEGRTLTVEIVKGPLPLALACHVTLQVAAALARAHQHGIVHRDVKPANIFLLQRGGDDHFVKLLDFGLARGPDDVALTSSNLLFGTPEYMSPEQVRGGLIGAKSDLYALGCVLFEMVTGRIPFEGAPTGVVYRHLYDLPPRPSELRPDITPELERLILRLLAKSPELRPADADEVVAELSSVSAAIDATRSAQAAAAASEAKPASEDASFRLSQLRGRVERRYPDAQPPAPVAAALQRASELAHEASALKQDLDGIEDGAGATGRETQLRIGSAIESLELDIAGANQALDALTHERALAGEALQAAAAHLLETWQAFEALANGKAGTLRSHAALMEGLRVWSLAQRAADELEQQVAAHKGVRADLQQQITQLRSRLLDVDATLQPTVAKAAELQLQLSAKLAALRAETERATDELNRQSTNSV